MIAATAVKLPKFLEIRSQFCRIFASRLGNAAAMSRPLLRSGFVVQFERGIKMGRRKFSRAGGALGITGKRLLAVLCGAVLIAGAPIRSASAQAAEAAALGSASAGAAATQPGDDGRPPLNEIDVGDYCTILLASKLQTHLNCSDEQRQQFERLRTMLNGALDNAAGGRMVGPVTPGAIAQRGHGALAAIGKMVREDLSPSQDTVLVAMFESHELEDVEVEAAVETSGGGIGGPVVPPSPIIPRGRIGPRGPVITRPPQIPIGPAARGGYVVSGIRVLYTNWGADSTTQPAQASGRATPAPAKPAPPVPGATGTASTPAGSGTAGAPAARSTIPLDVYNQLTPAQKAEIPADLRPPGAGGSLGPPGSSPAATPPPANTTVARGNSTTPPAPSSSSARLPAQIGSLADAITYLNSNLASAQLRGAQWIDTAAPVEAQRATVLALLKQHIMEADGQTRLPYVIAYCNWAQAAQKDDLVAIVAFPQTVQGISHQESSWAAAVGALVRIDLASAAKAMDSRHSAFFFKGEMQKVLQNLAEVSGSQRLPASQLLGKLLNSDANAKIKTVADAENLLAGSVPAQQVEAARWLYTCEITPADHDKVISLLKPHLMEPEGNTREPFVHAFAYWAEAADVTDLAGVVDYPETVSGLTGQENCWADAVIGLLRISPDAALTATKKRVSYFFFRTSLSGQLAPIATGINDETIYARQLKALVDNAH